MHRKRTVCQVILGLDIGGAEVLAAQLARSLSGAYRFVFACLDRFGHLGDELRDEGYSVWALERKPGVDLRCSWRLARLMKREQVDIIHAHQYSPFFYSLTARLLGARLPILFTEHGRWHPDYPRPKRVLFNRLFLRGKDRVVGVGESVRQQLIHNEGFPERRVGVVYNGVPLSPLRDARNRRASVRREIGVGTDDFVIIQVARLDTLKDHVTAVRTMRRVITRCPTARLVVVGEGPELDHIKSEIDRSRVGPYVRLLGLRRDIPRLLGAADVFLLTSVSEGIPLTIIEAMGAALPVVSTKVGGVPEVVEDEKTGLLVPAKDDAALAEALTRLGADQRLRAELGQSGCRRANELFSDSRMNVEYQGLYEEMLRG